MEASGGLIFSQALKQTGVFAFPTTDRGNLDPSAAVQTINVILVLSFIRLAPA
jgi:hypothetical protein